MSAPSGNDATSWGKPRKVKTGFRTVAAVATSADGRVVFVGGKPDGVEIALLPPVSGG